MNLQDCDSSVITGTPTVDCVLKEEFKSPNQIEQVNSSESKHICSMNQLKSQKETTHQNQAPFDNQNSIQLDIVTPKQEDEMVCLNQSEIAQEDEKQQLIEDFEQLEISHVKEESNQQVIIQSQELNQQQLVEDIQLKNESQEKLNNVILCDNISNTIPQLDPQTIENQEKQLIRDDNSFERQQLNYDSGNINENSIKESIPKSIQCQDNAQRSMNDIEGVLEQSVGKAVQKQDLDELSSFQKDLEKSEKRWDTIRKMKLDRKRQSASGGKESFKKKTLQKLIDQKLFKRVRFGETLEPSTEFQQFSDIKDASEIQVIEADKIFSKSYQDDTIRNAKKLKDNVEVLGNGDKEFALLGQQSEEGDKQERIINTIKTQTRTSNNKSNGLSEQEQLFQSALRKLNSKHVSEEILLILKQVSQLPENYAAKARENYLHKNPKKEIF